MGGSRETPGGGSYEALALDAAYQQAKPMQPSKAAFIRCVDNVRLETDRGARAVYEVLRKEVVLHTSPAYGSKPRDCEGLPPRPMDPWAPAAVGDPASGVIITCTECEGAKKTLCACCDGEGRVECDECGGSGRVMGVRGPRNCPRCRAKGDVKCKECRAGRVECASCEKVGRVKVYWTVASSQRTEIVADDPHGLCDSDDSVRVEDTVASPSSLPASLRLALDPVTERIGSSRVEVYERPSAIIDYKLPTGRGVIQVVGANPRVVEARKAPFRRRKRIVQIGSGLLAFGLLLAVGSYLSRHEWYAREGSWGKLLLLTALGWLFARWTLMPLTLGKRALPAVRWREPIAALSILLVVFTGIYFLSGPSAAHAAELLRAGQTDAAELEASAVMSASNGSATAPRVLDEVHLKRALSSNSFDALEGWLGQTWYSAEPRERLAAELRGKLQQLLASARVAHDPVAMRAQAARVAKYLPDDMRRFSRDLMTFELEHSIASRDWASAASKVEGLAGLGAGAEPRALLLSAMTSDLEQLVDAGGHAASTQERVDLLTEAVALASNLSLLQGDPEGTVPASLRAKLDSATRARERELAKERRAKQARARRAEREAAREARRQAAIEAREAARERRRQRRANSCAVRCCDGSCSPTCSYVHRGCCSHHGGVCG